MSYRELCRRVETAERRLEQRIAQVEHDWQALKGTTRDAMTPTRIVLSGALGGFLLGMAAPLSRLGGGVRVVQFASSLFALVGSLQATEAAEQAQHASEDATLAAAHSESAAETVADAVDLRP